MKMLLRTPAAAPVHGGSSGRSGVFRTLAGAPEKAQRPGNGQEPAGDNFSHRDLSRRTGYPHVNSFLIQEPVRVPAHWPVRPVRAPLGSVSGCSGSWH